jgi:chemosensory pili system protein ChpC
MARDEVQVMDGNQDKVRSLWVPLREINLLIPNMAVAEISSYRVPKPQPGMPEWFLGLIRWNDTDIPVISLESVCGLGVSTNPVFSRLMIVNSVRPGSCIEHYAIVTAGLPGLIQFGSDTADEYGTNVMEGLKCIVLICDEEAVIPDLKYLQGLLEQHLSEAA